MIHHRRFRYLLFTVVLLLGASRLHAQRWHWVQEAGGSRPEPAGGVAVDSVGNTYIAGIFSGNIAIGPNLFTNGTNTGMYMAKYGPTGALLWARVYTGPGEFGRPYIVVNPAGEIFMAGSFTGKVGIQLDTLVSAVGYDLFVARFTTDGVRRWTEVGVSEGNAHARGIAIDVFDQIAITGYFEGRVLFGANTRHTSAGGRDLFVARYGPTGAYLYSGRAGGRYNEEGYGISLDGVGNSFVVGTFTDTTTIAATKLASAGGSDILLAKFNAFGEETVGTRLGGPGNDSGFAVSTDRTGTCYVAGTFSDSIVIAGTTLRSAGMSDIFIARCNWLTVPQWGVSAGGPLEDAAYGIVIDRLGDLYLTGVHRDSALFGSHLLRDSIGGDSISRGNIFVAKYSDSGDVLWLRAEGGTEADEGRGVVVDRNDELRVVGGYGGASRVGPFRLHSSGFTDIFIGKLGADPTVITSAIAGSRFCAGDVLYVNFGIKGVFEPGNVFTAQLSDSTGDFSNPVVIGSVAGAHPALITATVPDSTPYGRGYRVRVVASRPAVEGSANGDDILIDSAPRPVILPSGAMAFCSGDSVVLDAGEGFSWYRWNTGSTTRRITVRQPGEYSVSVSFPTGCNGTSAPVQVRVFSVGKPSIIRMGSALETGSAPSYQWSLNGTPIPGATGRAYTPSAAGAYQVRITDTNGCSAISDPYQFTLAGVREGEISQGIAIYPHPNNGRFLIEMELKHGGAVRGALIDLQGQEVMRWEGMAPPGPYRRQIDAGAVPAGLYLLRLDADGHIRTREVVIGG